MIKLFSYKFLIVQTHLSWALKFSLIEIFLTKGIQWLFFYIHLSHSKSSAAKNQKP